MWPNSVQLVKHVDDIKLSNDKKKVFGEGIAYDTFDTTDSGVFAVAWLGFGVMTIIESFGQKMFILSQSKLCI